jgi:hypothetical protein
VVEAPAMPLEAAVQCALTGVSKGRMADVVNQRQRLRQIFVQAKRSSNRPGDLCDFHCVGQAAAEVIGRPAGKYLRLPRKAPERTCLHNALAIPLEGRTRRTQRRGIDAGQEEIVRISGHRASMKIECHGQF